MSENNEVSNEPTTAIPELDKRRGCGGCLVKTLMLCILMLICLAGAWYAFRNYSQAKLNDQLNELRQANIPTSIDQLKASYAVPTGELDTTADWERALALLANSTVAERAGPQGNGCGWRPGSAGLMM